VIRHFVNRVRRRAVILPLGVVIAATLWSGARVEAGMIVKVREQSSVLVDDLSCAIEDGFGSRSGEVDEPIRDRSPQPHQMPAPSLLEMARSLAQTAGGTSSSSNAGNYSSSSLTALADSLPEAALPSCAFCYLRERVVRLPQPPLGELLDPPKSAV